MKKMTRTIIFQELDEKEDMAFDYKMAYSNWLLQNRISINDNKLKRVLGINDIVKVKLKLINSLDESDETLRFYVYKTNHCNINVLNHSRLSHGLQISLGNEKNRNDWVTAEGAFTAKVFIDNTKKFICLIEDVILDIQMFYFYGFDTIYPDIEQKRNFSVEKVNFLLELNEHSYLGDIASSQYISFASFCREKDDLQLDYKKYIELWDRFNRNIKNVFNNDSQFQNATNTFSENTINSIITQHPKGKQLSIRKIQNSLQNKPTGEYLLLRTEKKPRKKKQIIKIESQFGMKKWKTGKIKIVSSKHRFTFQKMVPYVSIYEFSWKG